MSTNLPTTIGTRITVTRLYEDNPLHVSVHAVCLGQGSWAREGGENWPRIQRDRSGPLIVDDEDILKWHKVEE